MVQDLKAYFILQVITIKWSIYVQEKTKPSSMSQKPRLSSTKISGDLLGYKDKATTENFKTFCWGGKKLASCCPWVAFAIPWSQACLHGRQSTS